MPLLTQIGCYPGFRAVTSMIRANPDFHDTEYTDH
jgi:hypothetical protein